MSNGRFTTSSVEILKRRHGITDVQLDCLIENPDMACLARHFGNIGLLVSRMGLLEADETEVRSATSISHQEATLKCLKLWKRQNPLQATFRALLSIVLSLGDGGTAEHICQYLGKSNSQRDFNIGINNCRQRTRKRYNVYTAKVVIYG